MSTITFVPTHALQENDRLLVGASMLSVDSVQPDELDDDIFWVTATCLSGNFDQFETPLRAEADTTWQVLNASAR